MMKRIGLGGAGVARSIWRDERVSAPNCSGASPLPPTSFCSCRIASSTASLISAVPESTSRAPSVPTDTVMLPPAPNST
jgi:hypothetical protein